MRVLRAQGPRRLGNLPLSPCGVVVGTRHAGCGGTLVDVLEQRGGAQIERSRELGDRSQPRLAAGTLEQRHLRSVQVARVAESFLRQAGGEPGGPEVRRELRYRIHRVGCSTAADKTSTDNTLRSDEERELLSAFLDIGPHPRGTPHDIPRRPSSRPPGRPVPVSPPPAASFAACERARRHAHDRRRDRRRVFAVTVVACGGNGDGPAAFLSTDDTSAIFVQWTRTGNDVSGTLSTAEVTRPQARAELFSTAPAPGQIQQQNGPFTGTVRDNSVRLLIGSGTQTNRVNGRLDGDTLQLTIPGTRV